MRFIDDEFKLDSDATIGVEFGSKTIKSQSKIVKLQIWDTVNIEKARPARKPTSPSPAPTTEAPSASSSSTTSPPPPPSRASEGGSRRPRTWQPTKTSKSSSWGTKAIWQASISALNSRKISFDRGAEYAKMNRLHFIESSARTGYNASYSFELLTEKIIQKIEAGLIDTTDENGGVKLGEYEPIGTKLETKAKCC
jgi:GTPase SAR1 family protein